MLNASDDRIRNFQVVTIHRNKHAGNTAMNLRKLCVHNVGLVGGKLAGRNQSLRSEMKVEAVCSSENFSSYHQVHTVLKTGRPLPLSSPP
jgi:hypothetical protein